MSDEEYLFDKFIKNGMDISEFNFSSLVDKENFFAMYEDFLLASKEPDDTAELKFCKNKDITVYFNGDIILDLEITDDYETLKCYPIADITHPRVKYCVMILFLTIKELRMLISTLSGAFMKMLDLDEERFQKPRGKKVNLPDKTLKIVNNISKLQKSALDNAKKYKTVIKDKTKK